MNKKIFTSTILSMFIPVLWSLVLAAPTVAVVKSKDVGQYDEAFTGIKNALGQENLSIEFVEYYSNKNNLVAQLNALKPDLIITLGTSATQIVNASISTIPIVFSMVINPKGNGFTGSNITGASLDIPTKVQFQRLKSVVDNCQKIGVIYNKSENTEVVNKASQTAQSLGLTLKKYSITSAKDIPDIKTMGIDALWIIPDAIVCKPAIIEHIFLSSIQNSIPVMGISAAYAKAGAIIALSCDYQDIGVQTGEIAAKILKGANPEIISITTPRRTRMYLNLTVASRLGIAIPKNIIAQATKTYGK